MASTIPQSAEALTLGTTPVLAKRVERGREGGKEKEIWGGKE